MRSVFRSLVFCLLLSASAFAQHDHGRNAVRLLARGKVDDATTILDKVPRKVNSPVSASEKEFVLAMIACRNGDTTQAFDHAKKAVELGMPVERFAAGPRDVFGSLYARKAFMDWLDVNRRQPVQGPQLGSMTDRSVAVWVRTAKESDVSVIVEGEGGPFKGAARSSALNDYTAIVTVDGLKPETKYDYQVMVDGKPAGNPASFKTFPEVGKPARFSVGFGGGAGFTEKYERMWTVIGNHKLEALFLLGDNVYIDDPKHAMTQRYCYYRRQSQPEWRAMAASTPLYAIYDDHDFGENDCNPGPHIDKPAWKRDVWKVFTENWCNPSYGGGARQPGCWFDFYIGDVHFILTDGRYYRDKKGGSMLGPVQKKWFLETLKASTATFKVLVAPVPWAPGVKPGSKDTWDGFAKEREEIFSFIEQNNIEGVILMSADRHRTDMRRIPRPGGYAFYEVMSSKLTNVHTHGLTENIAGSAFIMGYNKKCSFGQMDFDTETKDPRVKFSIFSIDDEMIGSRVIRLSELKLD